jgi:hypothetical protein
MFKSSIATKLGLCILLILLADGLFYKQPIGWTVGLYAGLLLTVLRLLSQCQLVNIISRGGLSASTKAN